MRQGLPLSFKLKEHEYATWIMDRTRITDIKQITDNLFLLREAECEFTDQEWKVFSNVLCKGLAVRHRGDPDFSIHAGDNLLIAALENATEDTDAKWIINLAQGSFYFETHTPLEYCRFTRFCLVHGLLQEGIFEFVAFVPKTPSPQAVSNMLLDRVDGAIRKLEQIEQNVLDLQSAVKKLKNV